jgi:hypothetical protein
LVPFSVASADAEDVGRRAAPRLPERSAVSRNDSLKNASATPAP